MRKFTGMAGLAACLLCLAASQTAGAAGKVPQLNEGNIDKVVAAMTLDEKISLVIGYNKGMSAAAGEVGYTEIGVPGAAGATFHIDRLGIPSIILADGPAGLRINPTRKGDDATYYCTGFPIGTMLSSTWNPELVQQVGAAIGNEVLEYGVDVLLAPGANIHRNPLCGRNFEYYSEDPLLAGETAAAYISGVQSQGVGTSLKHFAVNSQELNRLSNNAIVSERALREIYLRNFEIAVRKAQPWTIMTSYNFINGVHAAENGPLLTDVLRGQWGFKGMVMTDWGGGYRGGAIIAAGNDLIMPGNVKYMNAIKEALKDGTLTEGQLDECVRRVLELVVKTPTFKKYKFSNKPDFEAHAAVARAAAQEGIVLLERGCLPLAGGSRVALLGVASYSFIAGGTGSGDVHKPYVLNLQDGLTREGFILDEGVDSYYNAFLKDELARCATIDNTLGKGRRRWFIDAERPLEPVPVQVIDKAASTSDVAVVTIGRISGEGKDRLEGQSYRLSGDELALVDAACDAFHSRGKKVVVLLNVCGVVETSSWKDKVDGVVLCWLPGQDGSIAVSSVLNGSVNPSGRLPMTFPARYEDDPSAPNFPQVYADKPYNYSYYRRFLDGSVHSDIRNIDYTEYKEDLFVGYRYYTSRKVPVCYPFGYGLSYTEFSWSGPQVRRVRDGWKVCVTVTNSGTVAGKDVVQVYLKAPEGTSDRPVVELKGFAKTPLLQSGKSAQVEVYVPDWVCDEGVRSGSLAPGWSLVAARNAAEAVL